ncbi:hypothetical protein HD599_001058 [Conyzicola lurida]|uniref:Uncharacterized protein n=1 Tax=Conyzicola lurida TaxID=1172621 RepID=A0A841AMH7_9MICO|nr:hypothetical protein [Conyzicola lurida]MBB5842735.1 hypothetical protein [Conyzicola lurida]
MSDVSKYLPLSQRRGGDESGVDGNWAPRLSAVVARLVDTLDHADPVLWDAPTLQTGVDVRSCTVDLVTRLRSTRVQRLRSRLGMPRPTQPVADPIGALREVSAEPRKRAIGDLDAAVVATLDIATSAGVDVDLDPITLGAVAVHRALTAPLAIRSVLAGRELRATDGEWTVGRGIPLDAPGPEIVLFLAGRTGLPSHRPADNGERPQPAAE